MKLFQIKNVHNGVIFKDLWFDKKENAKEFRDTANKEKHGDGVDYNDHTKHTFVVTYGPDHPRYQA